jgi:hypothetical protein
VPVEPAQARDAQVLEQRGGGMPQVVQLGQQVNPGGLSYKRQARYCIDVVQAHTMRRQIGEALYAIKRLNASPRRKPACTQSAAP